MSFQGFVGLMSMVLQDCRLCAALRRRVVVATGAANASFDQLYHTVASVQKWEHGRGIMVFDMGLTDWQRDQVRAWRDVALVALEEFSRLQHAHWKLRVHALLYAVHAAGKALWLDAGVIVHRRLAVIDVAIERHGVFLVQQAPAIGEHVSVTALHDLGLPEAARTNLPLLSTAVQGYADQGSPPMLSMVALHCIWHWRSVWCFAVTGTRVWRHVAVLGVVFGADTADGETRSGV